jgi:hypothetical protein
MLKRGLSADTTSCKHSAAANIIAGPCDLIKAAHPGLGMQHVSVQTMQQHPGYLHGRALIIPAELS